MARALLHPVVSNLVICPGGVPFIAVLQGLVLCFVIYVVGRVREYKVRFTSGHKDPNVGSVGGVPAHEPVLSHLPNVARLGDGLPLLSLLLRLLNVVMVVVCLLGKINLREKCRQVLRIKTGRHRVVACALKLNKKAHKGVFLKFSAYLVKRNIGRDLIVLIGQIYYNDLGFLVA